MGNVREIPKIDAGDFSEFKNEYLAYFKPVILKGAVNNWPAMKNWDIDYLVKKIGHAKVYYKEGESYIHPTPHDLSKTKHIESSFADYVKKLQSPDGAKYFLSGDNMCFITRGKIKEDFLPVYHDFSLPSFISEKSLDRTGIWVSARGVHSWLHYDSGGDCNLNAQIRGSKKAYFFHPSESKNVYMFAAAQGELFNFSQVNYVEPDFEKYPLFKNASYLTGELEEGDMLYIPKYWLHAFQHTGEVNINVNFLWKNEKTQLDVLESREEFIKRCMRLYAQGDQNADDFMKFTKYLTANPSVKNVVANLEKSFLAQL